MGKNEVLYDISKAVGEIEDDILVKEYPFEKVAKKRGKMKMLCVLAATLGVLTAGTYHNGMLQTSVSRYQILLGGSDAYTEVIQNIGYPVNTTVVSNGIRITLESVVSDDVDMMVMYNLEREDGLPLALPDGVSVEQLQTESTTMGYKGYGVQFSGTGGSGGKFVDFDPTDGTLQYVQEISYAHGVPFGELVPVHIGNIGYYENWDGENDKFVPVFIGQWFMELAIPVKRALVTPDSSRTLYPDVDFHFEGETVNIGEVTLSALGVQVAFVVPTNAWGTAFDEEQYEKYEGLMEENFAKLGEAEKAYQMNPTEERKAELEQWELVVKDLMTEQRNMMFGDSAILIDLPITLTKTDGTVMELVHYGGGGRASSSDPLKIVNIQIRYDDMLPVSEVQSLTIGEITVDIN